MKRTTLEQVSQQRIDHICESAAYLGIELDDVSEEVFRAVIYSLIVGYCKANSCSAIKMAYDIYMETAKINEKGGAK